MNETTRKMNKMNTIKKLVLAAVLAGMGLCRTLWAADPVEYYTWDEGQKKLVPQTCTDYTVVTPDMATFEDGQWYVVNGAVENTTGGIVVNGSAHLILCDEAKLVVTGAENEAGIRVLDGKSIRIYGQAKGTGLLEATGGAGSSGIGTRYNSWCGTIVIDGGTISATGKGLGAGIGGGGKVQVVTINGGTVTATGEADGAGIGGAGNSVVTFGTITINGGVVTAVAQGWGNPGIGTGYRSYEGVVRINGGEITAVSKRYAVGGTEGSDLAKIEFGSEKTVAVLAGDAAPGGFVPASDYAKSHDQHYVHIEFGKTVLWAREHPGLQMVVSNDTEEVSLAYYNGVYSYMAEPGESFQVYLGLKPYYEWAKTPASNPVAIESIQENVCINTRIPEVVQTPIEYLEWDRAQAKLVTKTCDHYTLVTPETSEFKGGWYVVVDDVVREGAVEVRGTTDNPTCLIVCDDKKLTVRGTGQRGIFVGQGKVFSVFGQQMSTGELDVKGHAWGAGIGGHGNNAVGSDCGTVNINGGIITAQSGAQGVSEAIGRGGELKSCTTEAVTLSEGFKWQVSVGMNGHDEQTVSAEEYMLDHHWRYARLVAKPTTFVTAQPFKVKYVRDEGYCDVFPEGAEPLEEGEFWVAMGLYAGSEDEREFVRLVYDFIAGEEPVVAGSRSIDSLMKIGSWSETFESTESHRCYHSDIGTVVLCKCRRAKTGDMVMTIGMVGDMAEMGNGETRPNELSTAIRTPYYAWNDETRRIEGPHFARAMPITEGTTALRDGRWYVSLSGHEHELKLPTVKVSGDAHLILEDGSRLDLVPGDKGMPGLRLLTPQTRDDTTFSSISIYGQKEGTGCLDALGDAGAAGIGTREGEYCRTTISIHGGHVTALGGDKGGAAIGTGINCWGFFDGDSNFPSTLAVNVYGGTVEANTARGSGGPGIGFGNSSILPQVALKVLGGDVTCMCGPGESAFAIGWGRDCGLYWADPYDCDYLRFTLGRGMGLWAGKDSIEGAFGRFSPAAYDQTLREHFFLPYARIMPAPPLSVEITAGGSNWRFFTYEVLTNGAPMEVTGWGDLHLDLPGVTEVEVVYTVADGYQIDGRQTWTKFIGVKDLEGESAFRVEPPVPTKNPVISRQNFELVRVESGDFELKTDDYEMQLVDGEQWFVVRTKSPESELFDAIWAEAEAMIGTRRTDEVKVVEWKKKIEDQKAADGSMDFTYVQGPRVPLGSDTCGMMVFKVTNPTDAGTVMTVGGERGLQAMTAGGDEVRTGSMDAECIKPLLKAEVYGSPTDEYNEYGYPIYDRLLGLKNETQPEGEVYFWVAFRRFYDSGLDSETQDAIESRRATVRRIAARVMDMPVGRFEADLGSIYPRFENAERDFYAATGRIASLGEFPVTLPRDTEEVFVFRIRPGANGDADAKVVAIGDCADIGYDDGRWANRLAGATVTIPYFAWDEAAGKVVEQPPVEAIPLPESEDGEELVLHGNRWYVVVGNRHLGRACLRVDVGTAHLILADGASLNARGGVTVDDDATLAIYSEKEISHDLYREKQSRMSITAFDGWAGRRDEPGVFGGALEIHGGDIEGYGGTAATIRNRRLAFYGGDLWIDGYEVGGSVISSRTIDIRGGYVDAYARYQEGYFGGYPLNVIAGEQDGYLCELNVGRGSFVSLYHEGIESAPGSSAIGDTLDVNLADGVYVWTGEWRSEMQLSSLPIYRARPKRKLAFNPSMEKVGEQDFEITAAYDDNLKTNGFTLKLPAEELRPGEKWCVIGFDEGVTRLTADEFGGVSVGEAMMLQFAILVSVEATIVGEEAFARRFMDEGIEGFKGCFTALTDESTIAIPSDKAVDLVLLAKVIDTIDLPVVTLGAAKELQSMADGETAGCGLEFLQKQEFSLSRNADGSFTMTMPEGDVLKPGESWAWVTLPVGEGDDDEFAEMFKTRFGAGLPAGVISFDMFMDEEASGDVHAYGATTERTITLPAGAAAVLVGRTRPGVSMEDGPCEYLALSFGMASHLNVPNYADWPRHDELFPNADDYCTVTVPEVTNAALVVKVDGVEVGYRPDGVYTVRKGSNVRIEVLLPDPENYELRSPSVLAYDYIQEDVTVGPWDVVVVAKSEQGPLAGQGFVVRRGADGRLAVDMSGEDPLRPGELWVCMTIDKGGADLSDMEEGRSLEDIIWSQFIGVTADLQAGELPLDALLTMAGAENVAVTTNETFAIPSDSELALVARAYDVYSGELGSERYRALSLGGARYLAALKPGEEVAGERWNEEHQVRYSAWDGEKIVHGLATNAQPLTAACFDADGRMSVTSNSFYAVTGKVRSGCDSTVIDIADGVTLSLLVKDGADLGLGRIHVPPTATLNVYGQDNCSGVIRLDTSAIGAGDLSALIGGEDGEGCGTVNVHGARIAVYDFRQSTAKAAIGGCGEFAQNGALNLFRGAVYINGETAIGIGGRLPVQINALGGSVTVEDGAIGGLSNRKSGIVLGAGCKLLCGERLDESLTERSVEEYEKMLADGNPPKCVRIVRPAKIAFDADIAALVAARKLDVMVRCQSEVQLFAKRDDDLGTTVAWTEAGGTYSLDCNDIAQVVYLVNGNESARTSDVLTYACVTGDTAVALADLNWHEPELVSEQKFEAYRCIDGRVRLTPKGALAEGESWLWIALPEIVAKRPYPQTGLPVERQFAQQAKNMLGEGTFYVGGKVDAGGAWTVARELRPLYNCFQEEAMDIPFLSVDGFHWGVSKEKKVFYAPADSEFAMVFKVYDAGIAQLMLAAEKDKNAVKAAAKTEAMAKATAVLAKKKKKSIVSEEVFMTIACRYMAETVGTSMRLQELPRLPEYEPGDARNPWPLGPEGSAEPVAYTNDTNTLVIEGKGPFDEPTKKPWLEEGVGPITEIVIKDPETELPDDIFEGLGTPEPIGVELPDGWPADDLPVPGQPWHGGKVKIEEGHWPLTVSNVKFQQRYPWNGLVDITFDLTGSTNVELGVWAKDGSTTIAASNFVGRTDMMFEVEGQKTVKLVWDADKDALPGDLTKLVLENATITVGTGRATGGGDCPENARLIYSGSHELGMKAFRCPVGASGIADGDELILKLEMSPITAMFGLKERCVFLEDSKRDHELSLADADIADFDKGDGYYSIDLSGRMINGEILLSGNGVLIKEVLLGKLTGGVTVAVGAESAAGLIDLAKGTRVARDIENIVIDPKWGDAATASVLWPKAETPRTYEQATVAPWDTDRLPAGKYEFAYKAGTTDYTAAFWLAADNWTVIDHETITGERPVTGEKVLVAGESVIKQGGKLVIEGEPEIIWDGAFKVEKGGKIYAPYFDVVVDPATGLVTLVPKDRPTVTGLRFSQRYPWNGLVDVFFTATYAKDPAAKVWVKLAAKLDGEEKQVKTLYLANDAATTNTQFQVAQGEVHLIWDTMKDVGLENYGALEITAQAALVRMAEENQPVKEDSNFLCLTVRDGSVDIFLYSALFESKDPYYPDLEYSMDGKTWMKYDPQNTKAIQLKEDESVYLRGNNPNGWNPSDLMQKAKDAGVRGVDASLRIKMKWSGGASVEASGSVMSLIDGKGVAKEVPDEYCFAGLFAGDSCLTKAPDLTATTVKDSCYLDMFAGTQVRKIKVLATGDPSDFEDAIQDVVDEIELDGSGTLVVDPSWREFGIPSSYRNWNFKFADEEDAGESPEPLCFTPVKGAGSIRVVNSGEDKLNIEFSVDGVKWIPFDPGKPIDIKCGEGESIYLRGRNPNGLTTEPKAGFFNITTDCPFDVSGNVMSLIDYENEVTEIPCDYCFYHLFENADIRSAPELPATVLKRYCYEGMFAGCSRMAGRVVLPAKDFADGCYDRMFDDCNCLGYIKMLAETYCGDSKMFGEVLLKTFVVMLNSGVGKEAGGTFVYSSKADVSKVLPDLKKQGEQYKWSVISESEEKLK